MLTTIGDQKVPGNTTTGDPVTYYKPVIVTASDYYPFGMLMPGRNYKLNDAYRYGFNGKEQDPEVMGDGNIYDYGFRIYNPRLGKFLSVDPLAKSYPMLTPYQFASNIPIIAIDLDGAEAFSVIGGAKGPVVKLNQVTAEEIEKTNKYLKSYLIGAINNKVVLPEYDVNAKAMKRKRCNVFKKTI